MQVSSSHILKIGKRILKEHPDLCKQWIEELNQYQQGPITLEKVKEVFEVFCQLMNIQAIDITQSKLKHAERITHRRLFIAVALKIYDQQYIKGYRKNITTNLRNTLAQTLNCHEIWISNVTPFIMHDLKKLKGYNEEVNVIVQHLTQSHT